MSVSGADQWRVGGRGILAACAACKARKTKCVVESDVAGCSYCLTVGLACSLAPAPTATAPPRTYVNALEQRLQATEELLRKLSFSTGVDLVSLAEKPDKANAKDLQHAISALRAQQEDFRSAATQINGTAQTNGSGSSSGSSGHGSSPSRQKDFLFINDRYAGPSSGPQLARQLTGSEGSLKRFRHDMATVSLVETLMQSSESRVDEQMPNRDIQDHLLDGFDRFYEPGCPFVHRSSFERMRIDGTVGTDSSFRRLLWMMLAVGSYLLEDPFAAAGWTSKRCFLASGLHNSSSFYNLNATTLFDLQASVCLLAYTMLSETSVAVWEVAGSLIRRCIDAGVHLENSPRYSASPRDDQNRRRAVWMLLITDRYVSATVGRPPAISEADFDVDFPLGLDEATLDAWEANPQQIPISDPSHPSIIFKYVGSMAILSERVQSRMCSPRATTVASELFDHFVDMQAQLTALEADLPEWLKSTNDLDAIRPEHWNGYVQVQASKAIVTLAAVRSVVLACASQRGSSVQFLAPVFAAGSKAARFFSTVLAAIMQRDSSLMQMGWFLAPSLSYPMLAYFSMLRSQLVFGRVLLSTLLDMHVCMCALMALAPRLPEAAWVFRSCKILAERVNQWRASDGFDYTSFLLSQTPPDVAQLVLLPIFQALSVPNSSDNTRHTAQGVFTTEPARDFDLHLQPPMPSPSPPGTTPFPFDHATWHSLEADIISLDPTFDPTGWNHLDLL